MSIPEHISTILPRVLDKMAHSNEVPGGGMSECARCAVLGEMLESAERCEAEARDALLPAMLKVERFKALWQSYRSALAQPFGADREQDWEIRRKVDEAFVNLDRLAKEGM